MTVSRSQPSNDSAETRTVHDPFLGKDVQVGNKLTDRLRGQYAMGPHLPNGRPEFGFRQFQAPPIQHEAAAAIEMLSISHATLKARIEELEGALEHVVDSLGYTKNEGKSPAVRECNANEAWKIARAALSQKAGS